MKTYGRKKTEDDNDVIVNLDDLCRLCLAKEEQLVPIFNDDEPIPLPIRIMACVALEVLEDDGLPNMICHPCRYQLEKYCVFRKKCETSDLKLRRHLRLLSGASKSEDECDQLGNLSSDQVMGSSVTFVIPEEGEAEVDGEEEGEGEEGSREGGREEGNISLPQPSLEDPSHHCTLKRELSEEHEDQLKDDEHLADGLELEAVAAAVRASLVAGAEDNGGGGEGTELEGGESERGGEGGEDSLSVRLLPAATGRATHVEVTTEDGSVLLMELTTEDEEVNSDSVRDVNGELKVFQCTQCPRSFARIAQLRRHSSIHSQQRGVTCSECEKWFPSRSALTRHERIHTGEKPFQCGICQRSFAQKEILYRHFLIHSSSKPFNCPSCHKGFTQREALRTHQLSHIEPRPALLLHRCNLCPKIFCHASGLSRHLVTHTGRSYKCADCDKAFNDKSSLRRHHRLTGHQSHFNPLSSGNT